MVRIYVPIVCLMVFGCRKHAETSALNDNQNRLTLAKAPSQTNAKQILAGPPEDISQLADVELQGRFCRTSFAWSNGSANWNNLSNEQRSRALLGIDGGLIRNQYKNDSVRIVEVYYSPGNIKNRWQEELRNGKWVRHGPEVYYHQDGRYEIMFRLDGEIEGTLRIYNADGTISSQQKYANGAPMD